MIYWRRYSGDYATSTRGFSMEMDGAYARLLDHVYETEEPLPLDFEEIVNIAKATKPSEVEAVQKVLARKFEKRADGWHNLRADAEIGLAQQARANGGKHVGKSGKRTDTTTEIRTEIPTEKKTKTRSGKGTIKASEKVSIIGQPYNRTTVQPSSLSEVQPPNQGETPLEKASIAREIAAQPPPRRVDSETAAEITRRSLEATEGWEPPTEGPRDGALVEPPDAEAAHWWLDDEALMFQGDEKGVVRVPGQPFEDYIARVLVAMGDGPWMDEQPAAMHNRITFWRAKGFNPPELMPLPAQASAPTRARAS